VSEPTTCETATIVRAEPFHMTDECHLRDNWNMAWCCQVFGMVSLFVCLKVFNATFNKISVISWRSVLLVEEN